MKNEKNYSKNYLILFILLIVTVLLTLYVANWYKTIEEYNKNNSVVLNVIKEIEVESLESFLLDNPEIILYISSTTDENIKIFDKEFKKIINKEDLNENIVYLNVNKDEDAFEKIADNYFGENIKKLKDKKAPAIMFFKDGNVIDISFISKNSTKKDIYNFLERNETINND